MALSIAGIFTPGSLPAGWKTRPSPGPRPRAPPRRCTGTPDGTGSPRRPPDQRQVDAAPAQVVIHRRAARVGLTRKPQRGRIPAHVVAAHRLRLRQPRPVGLQPRGMRFGRAPRGRIFGVQPQKPPGLGNRIACAAKPDAHPDQVNQVAAGLAPRHGIVVPAPGVRPVHRDAERPDIAVRPPGVQREIPPVLVIAARRLGRMARHHGVDLRDQPILDVVNADLLARGVGHGVVSATGALPYRTDMVCSHHVACPVAS